MRHFTEQDLAGLVTLDEAVEAMRLAFGAMASGGARVQHRVPTDLGGLRLNTMAAILPGTGFCGAKVYTAFNARFSFVTLLFSLVDGRAVASFEADALTRLRTAAVSCLAAEYLAEPMSETLAVFGTGVQAASHAEALATRLPIRGILVVGRGGARDFARRIAAATGVDAVSTDADTALARADVIVTATRSPTPLFDGRQLRPGCTLIAVGSARPDAAEVDATTIARCERIVVESIEAAGHEAGDLLLARRQGVDARGKLLELGELAARRAPGRRSAQEILLFESLGSALEDVAIAALAWSKLRAAQP